MSSAPDSRSDTLTIPKSALRTVGLAIVGLLVLVALIALAISVYRSIAGNGVPPGVDTSTYQAVFLSNGQVYFGKLASGDSSYYELRHVYLLQGPVTSGNKSSAQTLVRLVKEIHTPRDLVMIARNQVLYVENLDPSGKAYKLIASGG